MSSPPLRQIRATYNDQTIRVYQAYSNVIADAALTNGKLVSPPFKMERMTWVNLALAQQQANSGAVLWMLDLGNLSNSANAV